MISQWVQAVAAAFVAVAIYTHQVTVWQIIAASAASGIAMSFSAPAYQAMIIDLLDDRRRLPNAVAMNSLQFNLSRAIGPLLAGVTLAAWGSVSCFALNALSFLPVIVVLGRLRERQVRTDPVGGMTARLLEGFRFVRGDRVIVVLLAIVAMSSLLGYPYMTLMPMTARLLYGHDDARGLGILLGAVGAGALLGALALSMRMPARIPRVIVGALAAFGLALGALAFTRSPLLVVPLLVVAGCAIVVSVALCNTSIQQRVPDAMRGRVMSMYTFGFFAFLPFGNLLAGAVAEHRGQPRATLIMACGISATAVLAAFALRGKAEIPLTS
jgi:MFS family permease